MATSQKKLFEFFFETAIGVFVYWEVREKANFAEYYWSAWIDIHNELNLDKFRQSLKDKVINQGGKSQ